MTKRESTDELIEKIMERVDLEEIVGRILEKRKEAERATVPPEAWFLGPKAEHAGVWIATIDHILRDYIHWRRNYFPEDPIIVDRERLKSHEPWVETLKFEIDTILNQLKAHFPFYSPRYIAHMISEQTFPSVVGYFAGMLYNPNNVTEESAPITASLELEVGKMIAGMLGYNPKTAWAHICSGGTLANLEALWIARMAQFAPVMALDYCATHNVSDFRVDLPDGSAAPVTELTHRQLISLRPDVSVGIIRALAAHLADREGEEVYQDINAFMRTSRFNVSHAGLPSVLAEIGLKPVVFVSEAAHYSIRKAVNILGYGEACVRSVPVEPHFRMNTEVLGEELHGLDENEYVAAVIAVAGTTEEGAVDPIHKIKFIRDSLEKVENRSFWLHVDAAWGGYVRSVFNGLDLGEEAETGKPLNEICEEYRKAINIAEETDLRILKFEDNGRSEGRKKLHLEWGDFEVYSAFLAMPDADSITVDPHKLGYVPYPAGVIAFQNKLVTELVIQKAQYITDEIGGIKGTKEVEVSAVGPYIIEGSKPGAVAAACWLSHKTIPLTYQGHGRLIKTSLLNTQKLARYFNLHRKLFDTIEFDLYGELDPDIKKFTFELLAEPDTNLLCFLCVPMKDGKDGKLVRDPYFKLSEINDLNRDIYGRTTIRNRPGKRKTPYSQEYFVSRTILTHDQYHPASISGLLERLGFSIYEYERNGIFLLRSVVMNPWHFLAEKRGKNYLYGFLVNLHQIARDILNP